MGFFAIFFEYTFYRGEPCPALTSVQKEDISRKIIQWSEKYKTEWELKKKLKKEKKERQRLLAQKEDVEPTDSIIQSSEQVQH